MYSSSQITAYKMEKRIIKRINQNNFDLSNFDFKFIFIIWDILYCGLYVIDPDLFFISIADEDGLVRD